MYGILCLREEVIVQNGHGVSREFSPQHVLFLSVRGLSEGDAWHAEQGLAGFLGAFDVCDLEESFG